MTNTTLVHLIALPHFQGFYESVHDGYFDSAVEQLFQDDEGNDHTPESFHMAFGYTKPMLEAYCKEYLEVLKEYLKDELDLDLPSMTFESLHSPREYNFTTDTLYVTINQTDLELLKRKVAENKQQVEQAIIDRFTPCSGFIPFYSNSPSDWWEKPIEEYDHNELGTILSGVAGGWNDCDVLEHPLSPFQETVSQVIDEHMPEEAKKIAYQFSEQRES